MNLFEIDALKPDENGDYRIVPDNGDVNLSLFIPGGTAITLANWLDYISWLREKTGEDEIILNLPLHDKHAAADIFFVDMSTNSGTAPFYICVTCTGKHYLYNKTFIDKEILQEPK